MADAVSTQFHDGDDRILIAKLNRVAQRNAMSPGMVDSLLDLLSELDEPSNEHAAVRVLILAGEGSGFCAGSDLSALAAMDQPGRNTFEAKSGWLARAIVAHRLPVIASVHGFAIGGGLTLAAACDVVITTPETRWSLPEVPIGLFPAWGLEWVCDRVGRPAARRLSWGIDTLDSAAACEMGLADMAADNPMESAIGVAKRLADLPALQSHAVKSYFAKLRFGEDADNAANALFAEACATPQAAASFDARLKKNPRQG